MPPDLVNDQALLLKKRARRRLVGAVALVLLMLIILPQILQDRTGLHQQESVRIVMPKAQMNASQDTTLDAHQTVAENSNQAVASEPEVVVASPSTIEEIIDLKENEAKKLENKNSSNQKYESAKVESKAPAVTPTAQVRQAIAKTSQNQVESFTVQVGVYSDIANVKRLQDQLKQSGFTTYTEKATTSKGEGVRLKAGKFTSRQAAADALVKIKEIGLSGIVITND